MAQQYDVTAKLLLGRPRSALFPALYGAPVVQWHNVELPKVEAKRPDLVAETGDGRIFYTEIDCQNRNRLPRRICRNFILCEDRFPGREVTPVLIYMGREPMRHRTPYRGHRLAFDYVLIDMRKADGAALLGSEDIEDNMLALLTETADRAAVVSRVMDQLSRVQGLARHDLALMFVILAGLRGIETEIIGEVETMITLTELLHNKVIGPVLRDRYKQGKEAGRNEGRHEGWSEGLREGETAGERNSLLRLVAARFGPVPDSVKQQIADAGRDQIIQWTEQILQAGRLEDLFPDSAR